MTCARCGKKLGLLPPVDSRKFLVVSLLTHADVEGIAHDCPRCAKVLCGSCCLPRWEAMKKARGMNGRQLAEELEKQPDAAFSEEASCPDCAVAAPARSAGAPVEAKRSGSTLAGFLAIAVGAGIGAAALFANEHPVWGFVVGFLAVGMFFAAFAMSFAASCPICGAALTALHAGVNGPCGKCSRYLRLKDNRVAPLEEDCVQSIPMFGLPIELVSSLPAVCAGCGEEAVRTEPVSSTAWPGMSLSANVPHCGRCSKGASYASTSLLTASVGETRSVISLQVKSHRFYHHAMMMNSASYRLGR